MEGNVKEAVKQLISKIEAHTDGSFTVYVGVHLATCGGLKCLEFTIPFIEIDGKQRLEGVFASAV